MVVALGEATAESVRSAGAGGSAGGGRVDDLAKLVTIFFCFVLSGFSGFLFCFEWF